MERQGAVCGYQLCRGQAMAMSRPGPGHGQGLAKAETEDASRGVSPEYRKSLPRRLPRSHLAQYMPWNDFFGGPNFNYTVRRNRRCFQGAVSQNCRTRLPRRLLRRHFPRYLDFCFGGAAQANTHVRTRLSRSGPWRGRFVLGWACGWGWRRAGGERRSVRGVRCAQMSGPPSTDVVPSQHRRRAVPAQTSGPPSTDVGPSPHRQTSGRPRTDVGPSQHRRQAVPEQTSGHPRTDLGVVPAQMSGDPSTGVGPSHHRRRALPAQTSGPPSTDVGPSQH